MRICQSLSVVTTPLLVMHTLTLQNESTLVMRLYEPPLEVFSSSSQGCVYEGAEKTLRRQARSAGALHLPVPTALIRTAGFGSVDGSLSLQHKKAHARKKKACVTVTSRTPASEVAQGDSRPPSSAS